MVKGIQRYAKLQICAEEKKFIVDMCNDKDLSKALVNTIQRFLTILRIVFPCVLRRLLRTYIGTTCTYCIPCNDVIIHIKCAAI